MKLPRRILYALAPLLLAAPLALVAALPAQAQGCCWNIWEQNGSYAVGANDLNSGTAVIEVGHPGRTMTWQSLSGGDAGYWKFSNGNYMAANSGCNGVTIKSSASSNGTVWIKVITGTGGDEYFQSRYCANNAFPQTFLGGHNNLNGQWDLCYQVQGGCYTKINLHAT
jgi:hypothetical protein